MFAPDDVVWGEAGRDLLRDHLRDCLEWATTSGIDLSKPWQTEITASGRTFSVSIREVDGEQSSSPTRERSNEHLYRARYDWSEWQPSAAVVDAVAEATGTDPTSLPMVYDAVETDAIDSLFDDASADVEVRFDYASVGVRVLADGTVCVTDPDP